MQERLILAVVVLFPFVCTAAGAAVAFLLKNRGQKLSEICMGFAAGVMLAASVWSLLLPAIERSAPPVWLAPAVGLVAGAGGLLWLEQKTERMFSQGGGTVRIVTAITLHNLPEGMVLGLAVSLVLAETAPAQKAAALAGAGALALGIGIQNIPEGAAVSLPVAQSGAGPVKGLLAGIGSGLVEPLGVGAAVLLAAWVAPLLPWMMGLAAGAMVCVTADEMIPAASRKGAAGVLSVVIGFALMMALDVAL